MKLLRRGGRDNHLFWRDVSCPVACGYALLHLDTWHSRFRDICRCRRRHVDPSRICFSSICASLFGSNATSNSSCQTGQTGTHSFLADMDLLCGRLFDRGGRLSGWFVSCICLVFVRPSLHSPQRPLASSILD